MSVAQYKTLWISMLKKLEPTLQRAMMITWFKDTAVLGKDEGQLIIGLPLPMFLNWHLERYKDQTLKVAKKMDPTIEKIVYHVDLSLQGDEIRAVDILKLFPGKKKGRKLPNKPEIKLSDGLKSKMLNPRYMLDSFVVGPSNRLAHAAALSIVAQPGGKYNPLFIYGGVGLGKTHLLQAVGNELLKTDSGATVLYTTSEDFTNQVVEAIKHQKMEGLRKKYRQVDMLIIDDIQFFAGKERTQEEFFHTFNTLLEARKQVIISSDRAPQELHDTVQPRLRSRFERGMVADVKMPDYETRLAIIAERAQEYQIIFDHKVLSFIAEHVTDSVRSLEGVLMQAVAQYELEQTTPTVRSIAEIMCKLSRDPGKNDREDNVGFDVPKKHAPRFEDVLENVSSYYSIPIQDMVGASRARDTLIPRQIAMYLCTKHLRISLQKLGERFSGRDHSTVIHSVKKIKNKISEDPGLIREINAIERGLGVVV